MQNVYTVGQINSYIRRMFAEDFLLQELNIKGEVSNCKYHSSGHIYFTLKDMKGTISCEPFRSFFSDDGRNAGCCAGNRGCL